MQGKRIPQHIRDNAVNQAIKGLMHGVPVATTAASLGLNHATISYWLRHNIDAYHARLCFITSFQYARDPKKNAFRKRSQLERLVTYRRLHGMPPNPSPGSAKARRIAASGTPSVDRSDEGLCVQAKPTDQSVVSH
jgi:hypothetical protein